MKRIIYGSLSVLTAIGTVFVASKAEVLGGDRSQTQTAQETIESNQIGALSESSKNGLEGLSELDALGLSNSARENGAKNSAATFGAATAGNSLFAPGFAQGAEDRSLLLTPKANAGGQSTVVANPSKTGFSNGPSNRVGREQGSLAANPANINSNPINSTIQTSQVPVPAAPTPKPSVGAGTGAAEAPAEAVDTEPATIQSESQTLPTPGMDGSTVTPAPSLTGSSFSTPGSRGPILQLDSSTSESADDGAAETVVPASGAAPLTPAAPNVVPNAAPAVESFDDETALDEDEPEREADSEEASVETDVLEDDSMMLEDSGAEDSLSGDSAEDSGFEGSDVDDSDVDDSMTDDGAVDDVSEDESTEEELLEDESLEGDSLGEEPEMLEGEGSPEDDSLEDGSLGEDAMGDDAMDNDGMGDVPTMEEEPSDGAFEEDSLEENSLEEDSLEEESLEEDSLGDDVTPDGFAPAAPVMPNDGFTPNGITPSAPNGITPATPLEESPSQFPGETTPATPLPPTPVTPAPAAPPTAPPADSLEPMDPAIEGDAFDSPAPLGSESDRLIGEGFTPFQLSYLAVSGGLKEAGIPGGELLLSAYEEGDVSAEDIVNAGAMTKRLGTAANDESDYTKGVDKFLKLLSREGLNS